MASNPARPKEFDSARPVDFEDDPAVVAVDNDDPGDRRPSRRSHLQNSPFGKRLATIAKNAAAEAFNAFLFILFVAGARFLVEHLFQQSLLFDRVPIQWLFDAGDIAVIGRFIWNTVNGKE